jgi:hypothetical protein
MKAGDLVSFSDLTIDNTLCVGTGIILEVYPAKPYDYPTYLVEITVVSNKYVDSCTYQTICYADSWGMTIINTQCKAHQLALLLETSNKVMTTKVKSFSYFLSIAYKMLKNDEHFAYVVKGLSNICDKMLKSKRVSTARLDKLLTCYLAIFRLAPRYVRDLVMSKQ